MYQAEVSTPESRGFMVSMHGIMFAVGYSLSGYIGLGMYFISASGSTSSFPWRFPLAFQAVPALIMLLGSAWLPYSPRWLMQKGRFDEAEVVLKRLHYRKTEEHHETAIKEFYQLKKQLEYDRAIKATVSRFEVFKTAPNRKRALIVTVMMWFNMFTGVLIIANYAVILFVQLGISGYMPLLLLALWTTASFPGNCFTALFIDKFGRRKFMLTGACGILVSLVCECALQAVYTGGANKAGQRAAIFFIYFFILFWSSCFDATQYLYMSEIFPTEIRGQGTAVGMFNQFAAQIIILVAGPIALNNIGWKFFLVLICPTAVYIPVIYFFFPETRQRSLEDINAQFGETVAVHYFNATEEEEKEYARAIEIEEMGGNRQATPATREVEVGRTSLEAKHA
jgi:MFS family permease